MKVKVKVVRLCPTLCDPMDYTVHGILQARILEWAAFPFQGIFQTQGSNPGLPYCRQILYLLSHQGSPRILEWVAYPFSRDLPNPGIKPGSPALQVDSLPSEPRGKLRDTTLSSLSLLQGIFQTEELNQDLLLCRRILYQLSYQGSPCLCDELVICQLCCCF